MKIRTMKIRLTYKRSWASYGGEKPPWWTGFAYREFDTESEVFYPAPFNLFIALFHHLRRKIAWVWPSALMKRERYIYELGQIDGYQKGRYNKDVVRGAMEILRSEGRNVLSKNDPGA